ncbi:MAG: type I DNA topoisomerase [Aeriscardovia sp.]|nr:type I DNA topoisomerase [Aeriscardovia sp.]
MGKKPEKGAAGEKLVIVESPAKAKKIQNYLGEGYKVAASVGHVRILAQSSQVPASEKKKYGKFGVDIEDGFKPYYVTDPEKKSTITSLKALLKDASELYLATDEDREGEAIAWHLVQVLKPKVPVKRMVFQEITKSAIEKSVEHTRGIDMDMVEAQETRRILDRLYGYELSPLLWRKVASRTSAGRVQSVATRMIVEREKERAAFKEAQWMDVKADFAGMTARLCSLAALPIAQGKDFDSEGRVQKQGMKILSKEDCQILKSLEGKELEVLEVKEKVFRRSSPAPFTTSTLQQAAGNKLGLSSRTIMRSAQSLYENGYITYMRTDSTNLSQEAIEAAREEVGRLYPQSLSDSAKRYESRSPGAQEAHEAIRPAGSKFHSPEGLRTSLSLVDYKIYSLIYERTLASQMKDASGKSLSVLLKTPSPEGEALFETGFQVVETPGFLVLGEEGGKTSSLPSLKPGQKFVIEKIEEGLHSTQPPARYTEASLVKALEAKGIGRPSTYAAIISTIIDRGYAKERGRALVPSWLAVIVTTIMENYFSSLVDYSFTARMEKGLDQIAKGEEAEEKWLSDFYFGAPGEKGLQELAREAETIDPKVSSRVDLGPDLSVRVNHFGAYVEKREGEARKATAPIPDDLSPDELTFSLAQDLLSKAQMFPRVLKDEGGRKVEVCNGRFGYYVSAQGPGDEAKTASLPEGYDPLLLTPEEAEKLLSLPRLVGSYAEEKGEYEVLCNIGRYGAYLSLQKKGRGSAGRVLKRVSMPDEEVFTIGLEKARSLLSSSDPLSSMAFKTFPPDPVTGRKVVLKNGPFGPYVTDGITNAALPKGESVNRVDEFTAYRLLEKKRDGKKKNEG